MKKTTSIRLFLLLVTAGCCIAYGGGYYFSVRQAEERIEKNLTIDGEGLSQELPETSESAVVVAPYEYILREEDGFIVVYYADGETVYSNTAILVDELPYDLQQEIKQGKQMYSKSELYNFLESYSS